MDAHWSFVGEKERERLPLMHPPPPPFYHFLVLSLFFFKCLPLSFQAFCDLWRQAVIEEEGNRRLVLREEKRKNGWRVEAWRDAGHIAG